MTEASLFVTDYASDNAGRQFEFGHWANLGDFASAGEFLEHVKKHLKEADKKSPLPYGQPREEPKYTDFQGIPEALYSEAMGREDIERIYAYLAMDESNQATYKQALNLGLIF